MESELTYESYTIVPGRDHPAHSTHDSTVVIGDADAERRNPNGRRGYIA